MKKTLSLFLALVMALSLCVTAFAGNAAGTSVIRLTGDAADQVVDLKNGQRLSADSSTLVRLNVLNDPSAEEYTVTLDGKKLTPDHSTSQYHFYAVPAAKKSGVATLSVSSGVSTQALEKGTGTASDPYLIETADDLKAFRDKVNGGKPGACAKLMADITLDKSETWTAIGTSSNKYTGTFDGNGHTISGVVMKGTYDIGFFADTNKSNTAPVIKNLTIADSSFTTERGDAGAFLGYGGGVFENCHTASNVTVTNTNGSAGGIVGSYATQGQSDEFTLNQCSNSAAVTGTTYCGGIIGKIGNGKLTMTQCFNAGTVAGGSTAVGGLIGHVEGGAVSSTTHTMTDVYNVGSVSSEKGTNVGGLIGQTTRMLTIKNAYQHSDVANKSGTGAAIVGNAAATVTLTNVYKTGSLNDNLLGSSITGKAATKTEDELKGLAVTLGENFTADSSKLNNGFPILKWQAPEAAAADTLVATAKAETAGVELNTEGSTDAANPTEVTMSFNSDALSTYTADRIYLNPGRDNTGTVELGLALSENGELTQTLTSQKDGYTADELYFYRLPGVVERTVYVVYKAAGDTTPHYYKVSIQRTAYSKFRYGAISAEWRDDNPVIKTVYDEATGYLTATVKVSDYFARYENGVLNETNKAKGLYNAYDKPFKNYAYDISDVDENNGNQTVQFANVGRFWMSNASDTQSPSSIPAAAWWGSKEVADKYIAAANALKDQEGYSNLPAELKTNFEAAVAEVSNSWRDGTAAQPLYLDASGSYTTTVTEFKARDAMGAPMTGEYKLEQQENLMLDYMYIIKTYLVDPDLGSLKYQALQNVVNGIADQKDKLKTVTAMAITDDTTKSAYEYYYQRAWRIVNAPDAAEINTMLNQLGLEKVKLDVVSTKTQVIVGDKAYDLDLADGGTSQSSRKEVTVTAERGTGLQRVYFARTENVTVVTDGWEGIAGKGYTATSAYFYDTPTELSLTIAVNVNEDGTTRYYNVKVVYPAQSGLALGPSTTMGIAGYKENAPGGASDYDSNTGYISAIVGFDSYPYDGMRLYKDGVAQTAVAEVRPAWPTSSGSLYYKSENVAYFGRPGYYWLPVTTTVDGTTVEGLLPMRASFTYDTVKKLLNKAEPIKESAATLSQEAAAMLDTAYTKVDNSKINITASLYLQSDGTYPTSTARSTDIEARSYFGALLYNDSLVEKELNIVLDLTDILTTWSTNADLAEKQFEAYQKILNMDGGIHNVMDIHSTTDRDLYQKIRQAKWDLLQADDLDGINAVLKSLKLSAIGETEPQVTLGDINNDGEITLKDATLLLQHVNKVATLDDSQLTAADINGDGSITLKDATLLLQYVNKLIDTLPSGSAE